VGDEAQEGDAADDRRDSVPRRQWLCEPFVPYGPLGQWPPKSYVAALAAARGTGKSYLLLDFGIAALSGQPWLGFPVRHCASVLYVDFELDAQAHAERADLLARGRGLARVPPGLHYLDLSGESLHVPTPEVARKAREERRGRWGGAGAALDALGVWARALGVDTSWSGWGATAQERIVLRARSVKAQVILVDSLTIGGGTAPGDQEGWGRVLRGLQGWGGVPVLVLDHVAPTGHGGMVGLWLKEGLVRSVLKLQRQAGGAIKVVHDKANFSEQLAPFVVQPDWRKDARGRLVAVTFRRADTPQAPATPAPAPAPRPLPALRLVPRAADEPAAGVLRGHDAVDARVLGAVREGTPAADTDALAAATGYAPKTIRNVRSRLRKKGLLPREEAGA
jgi:hypothetical protein